MTRRKSKNRLAYAYWFRCFRGQRFFWYIPNIFELVTIGFSIKLETAALRYEEKKGSRS